MAQTMAEYLMEQGEKRGEKRGEERGQTNAKQDAVLKLLHLRFESVPESVTRKIGAMQSLSLLDSLFEKAVTAQTLDDIDWDERENSNCTDNN